MSDELAGRDSASSSITLVLGLGASALAMVKRLREVGQPVRVYSDQPPADDTIRQRFSAQSVGTMFGDTVDLDRLLDGVTCIAPSPAFPPHHRVLARAEADGIPIVSEPELAWQLSNHHTRLVGVTGTNGKTTTTQLIGAGLSAAFGPVPLLGNIGVPLTQGLTDDLAIGVLELSSFQLHYAQTLTCEVAVITNLADDHLTWHGNAQAYGKAKATIWAHANAVVVSSKEHAVLDLLVKYPPVGEVITVDPDAFTLPIQLLGSHNRANAALAHAACLAMGANEDAVNTALVRATPDAHRMQSLGRIHGVTFINDSKATNPHAAIAAIQELTHVHWIIGGDNKGVAYDALIPWMRSRAVAVYGIGTSHEEVARAARAAGVPVEDHLHLDDAFAALTQRVRPGDTVLLSPAAASTDQFTSYAQRGERFAQLVGEFANA
ncbi:UDP-N-acetylmuramoyl-L-alanine--D-glutamate ligase [Stomatohabitans albus]|uniref:UDP-N-acetylmuramoyl-L-alanine--D-glutamate ligase n=1 Tax=Stomatohabitans albus TaxID=3110766 RepID=UPI00300D463A